MTAPVAGVAQGNGVASSAVAVPILRLIIVIITRPHLENET
jgi:hypothetical protein